MYMTFHNDCRLSHSISFYIFSARSECVTNAGDRLHAREKKKKCPRFSLLPLLHFWPRLRFAHHVQLLPLRENEAKRHRIGIEQTATGLLLLSPPSARAFEIITQDKLPLSFSPIRSIFRSVFVMQIVDALDPCVASHFDCFLFRAATIHRKQTEIWSFK